MIRSIRTWSFIIAPHGNKQESWVTRAPVILIIMLRIIEEQYNLINRTKFSEGEWMEEPDLVKLIDEKIWRPCLILRNTTGNLCGYIGIHEPSKLYGKHYDDIDVNVHGGLTFAGENDLRRWTWWLGFDCAHYMDVIPGLGRYAGERGTYKNIHYVINELEALVKQIKQIEDDCRDQHRVKNYKGKRGRKLKGAY